MYTNTSFINVGGIIKLKKNRITEIIIATILIVSLASSYKYYIGDKKNQKANISTESSVVSDTKNQLMKLEKDDFIKTQVVGLNQPLIVYGSEGHTFITEHTTDNFQFEFSDFRILEKLPSEILKEKYLVYPMAYNADGSLKKENTCIAKVDFKITNKNKEMAVTMLSGFSSYHVDDQYEIIYLDTNQNSVFFDSQKESNGTKRFGFVRLSPDESYIDTVYFIIDKVTVDNCNLVIKVAPFGDNSQTVGGKSVAVYNNGYGFIKVKYSDIIWE